MYFLLRFSVFKKVALAIKALVDLKLLVSSASSRAGLQSCSICLPAVLSFLLAFFLSLLKKYFLKIILSFKIN